MVSRLSLEYPASCRSLNRGRMPLALVASLDIAAMDGHWMLPIELHAAHQDLPAVVDATATHCRQARGNGEALPAVNSLPDRRCVVKLLALKATALLAN